MKRSLLRKKPVQALLILAIAALIVAAGAFAWSSFSQSQINLFSEILRADVNLHDDFVEGPNKDVYVENSGKSPILVRVLLTELLEAEGRGSLIEGHVRDESRAYLWSPHNGLSMADETVQNPAECSISAAKETVSATWKLDDTFHKYYTFIMGGTAEDNPQGQIYYKPASPEERGEYDESGTLVRPPVVVSDPLTGTSPLLDAHQDYKGQIDKLLADGSAADEAAALEALGLKKTLTASVITMDQWVKGDPDKGRPAWSAGDFWVVDTDGWCYWAASLAGGTATGLLLDRVDGAGLTLDSSVEYRINVELQAVDDTDIGLFAMPDRESGGGGGISENGLRLVKVAAGTLAIDQGGTAYHYDKYTRTFAAVDEKGDPTGPRFVTLGTEPDINAPVENRLSVGSRVTLDALTWNGTSYENYDSFTTAPWYNLAPTMVTDSTTESGKPIYEVQGAVLGADGQLYLQMAPVISGTDGVVADSANAAYLASLTDNVDHRVTYPGSGPFALLWPGLDGAIGTSDDLRRAPGLSFTEGETTRHFYELGNGVFIQVPNPGDTYSVTPVVYYFPQKADLTGTTVDEAFPLQLQVGDKLDITLNGNEVMSYAKSADGAYTFSGLIQGADGRQYLYLGSARLGYLAVGSDKILGNAGDVRRWAGPYGIGTPQDSSTAPSYFTEPFLKDKTQEDLAAGKSFTVDGVEWLVLHVNGQGDRLVVTKNVTGVGYDFNLSSVDMAVRNVYAGSSLEKSADAYYAGSMSTLKPYVLAADIPENGLSAPGAAGKRTVFPLSEQEIVAYMSDGNRELRQTPTKLHWWTRSMAPTTDDWARVWSVHHTTLDLQASGVGLSNARWSFRPAAWVRFSDATPENFDPPVAKNEIVTLDGVRFKVVAYEGEAALLITEDVVGQSIYGETGSYLSSDVLKYINTWYASLPADGVLRKNAMKPSAFPDNLSLTPVPTSLAGSQTQNVAFLMSYGDMLRYWTGGTLDDGVTTYFVEAVGASDEWWHRSSDGGAHEGGGSWNFTTLPDGTYQSRDTKSSHGVRPALWIKFDALR